VKAGNILTDHNLIYHSRKVIEMKTRSAKAKGRRLQDSVRKLLLENFPQLEDDDIKTAIMGESGEDIHLSPAARKLIPYSIECKNQEALSI